MSPVLPDAGLSFDVLNVGGNWLKFRRQLLRISRKQKSKRLIPSKQARAFLSRFGSMKKFAPSRRIFQMAHYIDFADLRRIAA